METFGDISENLSFFLINIGPNLAQFSSISVSQEFSNQNIETKLNVELQTFLLNLWFRKTPKPRFFGQ